MVGKNDLVLNQATMIEAIQYWLDSKMKETAPTVLSVKGESNRGYDDGFFVVSLDSEKERPNKT